MTAQLTGKKSLFIIVIFISIIYFQSNFYDLIFLDDDTIVYSQLFEKSFSEKITSILSTNFLDGHYYRPLTSFSFLINSVFFSNSLFVYHITNFLLHILTTILIFLILRAFDYSAVISLLGALLFAVNPLHINAVAWIAGRGDLLTAFLIVTAFYVFKNFIKHSKIGLLIIAAALIFLAFISKEAALLVPFLFVILYFIERKELLLNKGSISVLIMVFIILGLYYFLRVTISSAVHINKFSFVTYLQNISVLPQTVSKFFVPVGIKALPGNDLFTTVLGGIILLVLMILPFIIRKINRVRYYFGLSWFIILLFPGMVFRTMMQDGFFYWDCRSYLPLVGLIFVAAEILSAIDLSKFKIYNYVFIILYILLLSTAAFLKAGLYENAISYWNSVKLDYPQKFLPYIGLYNYYNHIKDLDNAENQLIQAIKLKPDMLSIREQLIRFYQRNKQDDKAYTMLKETVYKKIKGSEILLEKLLSQSYELNDQEVINKLLIIYKDNDDVLKKINGIRTKINL